jgi:hypothetical protein
MTSGGFLRWLHSGKTVNCVYSSSGLARLISAWPNNGVFVLTWEECREGEQYNEQNFTRDERHQFDTAEELLAFVEKAGYPPSAFSP